MYDDSIAIYEGRLQRLLGETEPGDPLLPELDGALASAEALRQSPQAQLLLQATEPFLTDLTHPPRLTYSLYRTFKRAGDNQPYSRACNRVRQNLTATALQLFLGRDELLDVVQDYVWAICEETTWVSPYHERQRVDIDLVAAETGAMLAQLVVALQDKLTDEVVQRVRAELEQRIFQPYLARHDGHWWYKGYNNWTGVCSGSIGTAFLLLEQDQKQLAHALALVLESLDVFIHAAFEDDGSSTEGVSYWQYGLVHYIQFAEMLRQRTRGRLDILAGERMKAIARYPLHLMLSPERFANFSDCRERVVFFPELITRLAQRTGSPEILGLLAQPARPVTSMSVQTEHLRSLMHWNFDMALLTLLWWDGTRAPAPALTDSHLPTAGFVRLVSETPGGRPVVLVAKASHNGESHNHNDVGSFVLDVDEETFLCDPGPGRYDSTYFTPRRYENIFASSFGHSLPRIAGREQSAGREFAGKIALYEPKAQPKRVAVEIGQAYDVPNLAGCQREFSLGTTGAEAGTVWLQDRFSFTDGGSGVEEAFVTWLEADISGPTATLRGQRHKLLVTIEEPAGATFAVARYEQESRYNDKEGILKRLTFALPAAKATEARLRMQVRPR